MPRGLTPAAVMQAYAMRTYRPVPGYPERLIDDVVSAVPGRRVVEVGAGTGPATVPMAARRLDLTCVEPDPDLALVLRERLAGLPGGGHRVTVVESTFERFAVPAEPYDGLVSAQAWHLTDPATRIGRAARLLRPGGLLALFWTTAGRGATGRGTAAGRAVDEVYARHGVSGAPPSPAGSVDADLSTAPGFEYLGSRSYPWWQRYGADEFVDYLNTTAHHRILSEPVRRRLAADLRSTVDRHGGRITVHRRTDLFLARRAADPRARPPG